MFGLVLVAERGKEAQVLRFFLVFFCFLFFLSGNLFLLYIFFELSVFPILVMILGFGFQIEKIRSGYYLFFYSSFCSLPFLVVLFKLNFFVFSFSFSFLLCWEFSFVLLLLFLIKFPLYFLHLWLPKAHVEAPTTARMLLAGLLLKLGTGGFLRATYVLKINYDYFFIYVAFLGFVLRCFLCLFQRDLKALAAYSSVNHIMFLLYVFVSLRVFGFFSCVSVMLAHGFVSTLMFYFVGDFYHSSGTRIVYYLGGYLKVSLFFLVVFVLVWLFNRGIPPSLSFVAELVGFGVLFGAGFFFLLLGAVYFFLSFYYSLYVMLSAFLGKNVIETLSWVSFGGLFLMLWGSNLLLFEGVI